MEAMESPAVNDRPQELQLVESSSPADEKEGEQQQEELHSSTGEDMDIEAYASRYKGRTKVRRLLFISEHCHNQDMELEALRLAYEELHNGRDTTWYKHVCEKINGRLGSAYLLDQDWVSAVDGRAQARLVLLEQITETLLNANRTEESIQKGYDLLGDFHFERSHMQIAAYYLVQSCLLSSITDEQILYMLRKIILISVNMGVIRPLIIDVTKDDLERRPVTVMHQRLLSGLAYMEHRNYKEAARKFVDIRFDLRDAYPEVIACEDVGTYGGLCALASFDRAELKSKVINNPNFKNFLELVPEVRELIHDFYASNKYASCLCYLQKLKANLLLDVHLHNHVERLFELIRNQALIQYTTPFISVDLNRMAGVLNTTVAGLEKELAALIMDNEMQARIDSHNKILHAQVADQRNVTFLQVFQTGLDFEKETRSMLTRMNLLKAF